MMLVRDIFRPLAMTAALFGRFWPQLLLVGAIGAIAHDLLLEGALAVGRRHPLGGMVTLSLVVLAKLLVVVTMFAVLRPGLPALAALRGGGAPPGVPSSARGQTDGMLAITAAVILPFFAYYAAWGFLGDTIREYSRLALSRLAFGEKLEVFDLLQSRWLLGAIAVCWAIRWLAKRMKDRAPWWRFLIVAADASWIFIGLYALTRLKNQFIAWIGAHAMLESAMLEKVGQALSIAAHAAEAHGPPEFRQPGLLEQAQNLFFYALLPLVWLVMAAIIYGYELSPAAAPLPTPGRRTAVKKWAKDFTMHFVGGYRSRYRPVWTCLRLTLSAGLATLLTFVIAYRALNWLSAWLWYGATRTLGPFELDIWELIADGVGLFIGRLSELSGGILFGALRIALLAAVLEYAVATQTSRAPAI